MKNRFLVWIILGSTLVCIFYSFWHRITPLVDAQAYDQIALNLLAGNGFKENAQLSFTEDTAMLRAGPGYEFFLAGIYWVFGHYYEAVWILQALLHGMSAWLLYRISRELFVKNGDMIGLVAAALFGFSPDLIEISSMLMTETLYLFFTIGLVYLFLKSIAQSAGVGLGMVLGFCMAIGILTRPPLLLFVPIFVGIFCWQKKYHQLFGFLLALAIGVLPWVLRNYYVYNQVIVTTLIGDYNIWIGNTVRATGGQISGGYNPVTEYVSRYGVGGLAQVAKMEFFNFIFTEPVLFIKLCLLRVVRYFSLIRPMGFWFYQTGWSQLLFVCLSGVSIAFLFVVGWWGALKAWSLRDKKVTIFFALMLTAPILLLVTVVESRYRFQIYPFLAVYAAYAVVETKFQNAWWKQKDFLIPVTGLGLISLLDMSLYYHTVIEHLQRFF